MEDVAKTYDWLINTMNIDPKKIIIGGDDVGAAIALDTLFRKIPARQKPAGLIFASPYTGLEAGGESWRANLGLDMINENSITRMENAYMKQEKYDSDNESEDGNGQQELQPFGYLSSNVEFGSFLPNRLLLYLGGKEVLLDEGGFLASRARSSGIQVVVVQEPTGIHLWSMLPDILTDEWEIKQNAVDRFVHFVAGIVKK
jgi:acetyl esterase/lipase